MLEVVKGGFSMSTLFFLVISLVGACLQLLFQKRPRTAKRIVEVLLLWMLIGCVGLQGLFYFSGHAFEPDLVAKMIGWPTGSPFQFEIAIANLSYGVLGILCIWIRGNFWYATAIGDVVFYLGDAYGHIVQIVRYGDYAPANSGLFLYCEIITALGILALIIAYKLLSRHAETGQVASVPA